MWAVYVLPMYFDMWLLSDYLARYYSLCDIGTLVPVLVMVISSGFVSADEFRLCVSNEFWLCVGDCHVALG